MSNYTDVLRLMKHGGQFNEQDYVLDISKLSADEFMIVAKFKDSEVGPHDFVYWSSVVNKYDFISMFYVFTNLSDNAANKFVGWMLSYSAKPMMFVDNEHNEYSYVLNIHKDVCDNDCDGYVKVESSIIVNDGAVLNSRSYIKLGTLSSLLFVFRYLDRFEYDKVEKLFS